jgi:hypothetical protein
MGVYAAAEGTEALPYVSSYLGRAAQSLLIPITMTKSCRTHRCCCTSPQSNSTQLSMPVVNETYCFLFFQCTAVPAVLAMYPCQAFITQVYTLIRQFCQDFERKLATVLRPFFSIYNLLSMQYFILKETLCSIKQPWRLSPSSVFPPLLLIGHGLDS